MTLSRPTTKSGDAQVPAMVREMEKKKESLRNELKSQRIDLALQLLKVGHTTALIVFSGVDDSGSIDGCTFDCDDSLSPFNAIFRNDRDKIGDPEDKKEILREDLKRFTNRYLETVPVDWYNDEGGQGFIKFDVSTVPFSFTCSIDQNRMVTENAYKVEVTP